MVPHSKSIRFPRSSRRNPFCADMRKVRWNFPYVESNRNYTNRGDYRNRLTSVTKQEFNAETQEWTTVQIVEYTYDYNNVWIRKTLDSNGDGTADSKTIFIPENYQTVTQIDNNTITHHYLWTPNTQDKLLADVTTNDVLWALTDHLGTIRDIVGNSTIHLIYDAFGNIISCKNSAGEMVNNPLLFAYTGKAFDTSTALQNNINRWYDSTVGRWLSTDPIGFEGNDNNLYRYIQNNSSNRTDSTGLQGNWGEGLGITLGDIINQFPAITPQQKFLLWYNSQKVRGLAWTESLPACPCQLNPRVIRICNTKIKVPFGGYVNPDATVWENPSSLFIGKHPGAKVCMRSESTNGHSEQCCYDSAGALITEPPGAGSADFATATIWDGAWGGMGYPTSAEGHYSNDVIPYDLAIKLDGGVCGMYCRMYYEVRPAGNKNNCPQNF